MFLSMALGRLESILSLQQRLIITPFIRLFPVAPPRSRLNPRSSRHSQYTSNTRCYAASNSNTPQIPTNSNTPPKKRRRLDEACLELHPEYSRNIIQSWIAQGKVLVDDRPIIKAGTPISSTATITITAQQPKFVCRAGLKLESALKHFNVDPTGMIALDAGLSTGGFTDCLLQYGAVKVFGVDVGYGQVAEKIRVDPRVVVMERTNLRHLRRDNLPLISNNDPGNNNGQSGGVNEMSGGETETTETINLKPLLVDIVTLDLSFISVFKVRETVCDVLIPNGHLIVLIKPQFEAGKKQVGTGGVVKDPAVHAEVVKKVIAGWEEVGFECHGWIESPIKGATSGNTEFLAYFKRDPNRVFDFSVLQ